MKTKEKSETRLIFFSFGILEQGGGFENFLISTARGLADRYKDLRITIVTMSPEVVERLQHLLTIYFLRKQNPKAIYRESSTSIHKKLGDIEYRRASSLSELEMILEEGDIIYSKNEVLELLILNRIGLRRLPPIILGVHTPIYYPNTPSLSSKLHNIIYTGVLYRKLIRHTHSIQVNNADDLELIRTRLRYPNVRVVRQAFTSPRLKRIVPRGDKLKILFIGRLTEAKGIDLLIDVVKRLQREQPDSFVLKIAGSGEQAMVEQIKQLSEESDAVTYLGHIKNTRVGELYDWADITLVTSHYETLNKVAIETAIAGKVVVCSDIPGPREIIKNETTGFLVRPDATAFTNRIIELAQLKKSNPDTLRAMGQAAHTYIKNKFNPTKAYGDLYQEIISASKGI
jgi:glycosyltransferase involved in cell wall biosynthesis